MHRLFVLIVICTAAVPVCAAEPRPPLAEKFLHEGRFADGEQASLLALDANPTDDETRFGLGVIQFVRAVENLGKAIHMYQLLSERSNHSLPNELINYKLIGLVLDSFASELSRAESTLAGIKDDKVKLRLRLAKITIDFVGTGKVRTTLIELLNDLNRGRFDFPKGNPDYLFHFDRGDVAWLRAYCHLLSAMVECYQAVNKEEIVKAAQTLPDALQIGFKIDSPPLRRLRLRLLAVCELNRETWEHIRKETDDDYEWLPHPKQTDQLGLTLTNEQIDVWLDTMAQLEGLLNGKRLVPSNMLRFLHNSHPDGQGLNLKKLLDDPPGELFGLERIKNKGIDAKYLEAEHGKMVLDIRLVFSLIQLFNGPFGFARAARLN